MGHKSVWGNQVRNNKILVAVEIMTAQKFLRIFFCFFETIFHDKRDRFSGHRGTARMGRGKSTSRWNYITSNKRASSILAHTPLFGSIQFITETTHKKYIQIAACVVLGRTVHQNTNKNIIKNTSTLSAASHTLTLVQSEWKNYFVLCVIVLVVSTGASRRLTRIEITANRTRTKKQCFFNELLSRAQ